MPTKKAVSKPVWEKKAPKTAKHRTLTDAQKAQAKARAQKAGRPYPNAVDNIAVARKANKKSK